jgi:hypothetical protein
VAVHQRADIGDFYEYGIITKEEDSSKHHLIIGDEIRVAQLGI